MMIIASAYGNFSRVKDWRQFLRRQFPAEIFRLDQQGNKNKDSDQVQLHFSPLVYNLVFALNWLTTFL